MGEERREILKMIAEGKISPEEGERLLDALKEGEEKAESFSRDRSETGRGENRESANRSWEDVEELIEQFGPVLERKIEHWAEGFGREIERFFDGRESSCDGESHSRERDTVIPEDELPGWDYDSSETARDIPSAEGILDFTGIRGIIIQSRMGGESDIALRPSGDRFCRCGGEVLHDALRRGDWAVLNLSGGTEITVPEEVEKIGLILNRGDVLAEGLGAELWMKVSLGDVKLYGLKQTVWATVLKGDFDVGVSPEFSGKASLNTLKGDINCTVSSSSKLEFTARSIKGYLEAEGQGIEVRGQYSKPGHNFMTGTVGDGTEGSISLETTRGDITIGADVHENA